MGDWSEHGSKTGGYYECNKYKDMMAKGDKKLTTDERKRTDAKNELDRYMFYFERYNGHDKSEKHARGLKPIIENKIIMLNSIKHYPLSELEFLREAVDEVIKTRQVLTYTYVYGYYLKSMKAQNLFEFMQ